MKNFLTKLLILFIVNLTLSSTVYSSDLKTLELRMLNDILDKSDISSVDDYLSTMRVDGSWSDILYNDPSFANWDPVKHLDRVKVFAEAYSTSSSEYYSDSEMFNNILLSLNYWYNNDPITKNWWWERIGKNQRLGVIGVLLKDVLPSELKQKINNNLRDFYPQGIKNNVGANRFWYCDNAVNAGILTDDEEPIIFASDYYMRELFLNDLTSNDTKSGGIKPDYCFWQHGSTMLIGGYGFSMVKSIGHKAKLFKGLAYAFPQEKLDIMANFTEHGLQWFVRRNIFDISAKDRNHTRKDAVGINPSQVIAVEDLGEADINNADIYSNFVDHIEGNNNRSLIGNRHFWYGDFQSHRREGYMVGLKIQSTRVRGPEHINNENNRCEFMNYGNCFIYKEGDEYYKIFPAFDYARIPGITSRHIENVSDLSSFGKGAFTGGVSDGTYGSAVQDFDHNETKGKKSWFFFDEAFVALGTNIESSSSDEINTTLNQCHVNSDTYVENGSGTGSLTGEGIHSLNSVNWVHQDGVGYIFPNGGDVNLRIEEKSGNWSEIGKDSGVEIHDIFTLYLDHGVAPTNGSYEYMVMPDATREEVQSFVASNNLVVIENSNSIQAVYHKGLKRGSIVFYQAGTVSLRNGLSVSVDSPCLLMIDESDAANFQITASNPKNESNILIVSTVIDGKIDSTVMQLPDGVEAGSSLTLPVGNKQHLVCR